MPRKTKKNKKSVKDKKELRVNTCEIIDIGNNNSERWNSIKKQFNFKSDEDFVNHLLDLAEQELSKTEKGDSIVAQALENRDGNSSNFTKYFRNELLPSSLKEEKKNSKMPSLFHTADSKPLMDDKINLENSTQSVLLQDRGVGETASDEEKENVGIIPCENQTRLNSELSCPLTSDNLTKRTAEMTLLDSSNNNDILKEAEQNLDYSKVIKKHKKKLPHESPSSCTLLDTTQNTSKHKKKKQSKHVECGKVSDPITSSDISNKSDLIVTLSVNESNLDVTGNENIQSDVVRTENNHIIDNRLDGSVVKNDLKSDSEVHRVSITIKLCCDCDSRHLQDGCPLRNPQRIVHDSVDINHWLRSNSPDLQYKDEESSFDESNRTDFSSASLPECLELKVIDAEHGLSVIARETLSASTQFGPLIGQPIKEMEIPDDFSMKDIWEVIEEGRCSYISTQDPECSNWLRWLRPAPVREARNLVPIQTNSKLYFITTSVIPEGKELLYWSDHVSSAWSNKKMTKTSDYILSMNVLYIVVAVI